MGTTTDDIVAIHHLVALHGHLVDARELDRLDELVTADVVYDASAMGGGPAMRGIEELRARSAAFVDDDRNPVGHHVTNVIVTPVDDGRATARSKALGVARDGRVASVVYDDEVVRTPAGWRIRTRTITPARPTPEPGARTCA